MFSRKVNLALLIFAMGLNAVILYHFETPWVRLVLGLGLMVPVILISGFLGLAEVLAKVEGMPLRPRRFLRLRANVDQLMGQIKRLNWLVYDRNQGYRKQAAILAEIEACRAGMEEALQRVVEAAGKPDPEVEEALGVIRRDQILARERGSEADEASEAAGGPDESEGLGEASEAAGSEAKASSSS